MLVFMTFILYNDLFNRAIKPMKTLIFILVLWKFGYCRSHQIYVMKNFPKIQTSLSECQRSKLLRKRKIRKQRVCYI